MRFNQIVENTTAGSVATVAQPMMTQTRENTNVRGLKPVQQVLKGKAVKKGPYANSIVESKVTEDDLSEQDLIVVPGQGRLKRTGFVKHDLDQGEHEGHTLKNSLHTIARAASDLDERLSVQSEFPEWVSEKIGAAKSMMVSVMDYLISSQEMQGVAEVSDATKTSYLEKATQQVKDLKPHAKKGEYKDIAQRMISRREKGIDRVTPKDVEEGSKYPWLDNPRKKPNPKPTEPEKDVAEGSKYPWLDSPRKKPEPEKDVAEGSSPSPYMSDNQANAEMKLRRKGYTPSTRWSRYPNFDKDEIADIGAGGKEYNVKTDAAKKKVSEGAMPASVIRVKEKIRLMTDAEKKEYFKGKTQAQLQQMARRHGYGENSKVYAKYATQDVAEGSKYPWLDSPRKKPEPEKDVAEGFNESLDDLISNHQHHTDLSRKYLKRGNNEKAQQHHTKAYDINQQIMKHPDYELTFIDDPRTNDALAMNYDTRFNEPGVAEATGDKRFDSTLANIIKGATPNTPEKFIKGATPNTPKKFIKGIKKVAKTKYKFQVGDWVTIDPNETAKWPSSGMIGRISRISTDGTAVVNVNPGGGASGGGSSGTHTSVPTSMLEKLAVNLDDPGVAEGSLNEFQDTSGKYGGGGGDGQRQRIAKKLIKYAEKQGLRPGTIEVGYSSETGVYQVTGLAMNHNTKYDWRYKLDPYAKKLVALDAMQTDAEYAPDNFVPVVFDDVSESAGQGVAEGSINEGQYEMMMRNGQVKKFIAKDDADAKRIAAGHGAKSVIKLRGGVPAGKVSEQGVAEGGAETSWSNDTDTITLQDILELTKHIKQINLPINDNLKSKLLHWEGNPDEIERVNQVTVSNQFPILIMVDEQGQIEWILDGNHRLHKAIQSQAKTIPAKLIKPNNLNDKAKKIFNIKEQGVAEDNLNELDMFAPVTTYVRLANGTYVAASWRRNQNLSTASNSASFIDIKPVAPNVAKQLGLDQRLNDPEKKYTGAATIASGGPIQSSGPLADRTINVVDISDPKAATDLGVPDTLFGKISQWAQQQGQKEQGVAEEQHSCPHCNGPMFSEMIMNEKKDACYYKVKSRYKVWPSAYASGALVKCRKKGASNWGKNESSILEGINQTDESLHDWFNKEKWVRMDTKGNIKGPCAREPGEGKPKCLPQSKAHSLGKKGRASAAARKRREDPNPERSGKAINVNTKKTKG